MDTDPILLVLLLIILASGSVDRTIRIWNIKTGTSLKTLQGHTSFVNTVTFNQDGLLASGSNDRTIKIWDYPNINLDISAFLFLNISFPVISLTFFSDYLLSGLSNSKIVVFDTNYNFKIRATLTAHKRQVTSLLSLRIENNDYFVSASSDNSIIVWNEFFQIFNELKSYHSGQLLNFVLLVFFEHLQALIYSTNLNFVVGV